MAGRPNSQQIRHDERKNHHSQDWRSQRHGGQYMVEDIEERKPNAGDDLICQANGNHQINAEDDQKVQSHGVDLKGGLIVIGHKNAAQNNGDADENHAIIDFGGSCPGQQQTGGDSGRCQE